MKIVTTFRCESAKIIDRQTGTITLDPVPDVEPGNASVIIGTGRGPCELGRVALPPDCPFAPGKLYEIEIREVRPEVS